ncbi:hypothetical protein ACHAWU_009029 [Discostella pseudostelligera]|uniref:Zinc finger CHCC-type domain-containing protein n=1 Tax=Discostella pseudostelligera TaxID=259834 RepID=A0ABD3MGP2_9STRA
MMLSAATAAQSLLRRPAARLLPSSWASASVTSVMSKRAATMAMSTLPPELPESVLSGEDKSLNRLTRTESMVRSDASQFRVLSYSLYLCLIDVRSPDELFLAISFISSLPPRLHFHHLYQLQLPYYESKMLLYKNKSNTYQYKLGKHRSNALELINKVPPIEVSGDMAICDGGGGALGHPVEYIKVGNQDGVGGLASVGSGERRARNNRGSG